MTAPPTRSDGAADPERVAVEGDSAQPLEPGDVEDERERPFRFRRGDVPLDEPVGAAGEKDGLLVPRGPLGEEAERRWKVEGCGEGVKGEAGDAHARTSRRFAASVTALTMRW